MSKSRKGTEGFSVLRITPSADQAHSVREAEGTKSARVLAIGTFRSESTGRVAQLFAENDRQIVSIDGQDLPYEWNKQGELVPLAIWNFVRRAVTLEGDPNAPVRLRLAEFGDVEIFERLPRPEQPQCERIAGEYWSDSVKTTLLICLSGSRPTMRATCPFGSMEWSLERLGEHIWRVNSGSSIFLDGILSFRADWSALSLSSYVMRALVFQRIH